MRIIVSALVLIGLMAGLCAVAMAQDPPTLRVHGYMQNRVYSAPGSNPQFRSERISISTSATLPNDSAGYVEVYYHPWAPASGLYLESAYYDTAAGPGRVRIGKGRRLTFGITPSWPNRKTSNYGIVSEAVTMDRIQGIQYYLQQGILDAGLSVHTGYRLGTRAIGEIPGDAPRNAVHAVPHLTFRDLPGALSQKLALSGRLGGKWDNGLKAGVSLQLGSLDSRDLNALVTDGSALAPGGTEALLPPATTNTDKRVLGLDATWRLPNGFIAQGEWYDAKVSDLGYSAWNALAGYEAVNGWKFFARYAQKNMGIDATDNPLSWDLQQTSISIVQPLRRGLWIQYEYEINNEKPGSGIDARSNNLFFVKLFTAF